jgi:hypothetical protein
VDSVLDVDVRHAEGVLVVSVAQVRLHHGATNGGGMAIPRRGRWSRWVRGSRSLVGVGKGEVIVDELSGSFDHGGAGHSGGGSHGP